VSQNRIAIITAHPDDEAFCAAVTLYEATLRGHEVLCLVATNGDAGKTGRLGPMSPGELAVKRKEEMKKAAEIIGITTLEFLGYLDGKLDQVERAELTDQVVRFAQQHQV
jgi:LmbE family N-acetylglucosaminyl deacetylase